MIFILEDNDERIAGFVDVLGETPHHIERTVPASIAWLTEHAHEVVLYSLDNDLYVPDADGDQGEGRQLLEWILANAPRRPVLAHTTNSHAATTMELACADAAWGFQRVAPFDGNAWIRSSWIEAVRERLAGRP